MIKCLRYGVHFAISNASDWSCGKGQTTTGQRITHFAALSSALLWRYRMSCGKILLRDTLEVLSKARKIPHKIAAQTRNMRQNDWQGFPRQSFRFPLLDP
jgi:hypothetical protein